MIRAFIVLGGLAILTGCGVRPDAARSTAVVIFKEEAKNSGVMNRLLAEMNNPQADVY